MSLAIMTGSPRADLAALTETRVMQGVAALFGSGVGDFTYRSLAAASGVPERTIYRYYPTKEAVFAAFWVWLRGERLGLPPPARTLDELFARLPVAFAAFDRSEPLIRAMLHDPHGRATRLTHAEARRAELRAVLAGVLAALDPAARTRLLASVQLLFSAAGWETMKDYWGLSGAAAADAACWAVAALIAQARGRPKPRRAPASAARARKRRKG